LIDFIQIQYIFHVNSTSSHWMFWLKLRGYNVDSIRFCPVRCQFITPTHNLCSNMSTTLYFIRISHSKHMSYWFVDVTNSLSVYFRDKQRPTVRTLVKSTEFVNILWHGINKENKLDLKKVINQYCFHLISTRVVNIEIRAKLQLKYIYLTWYIDLTLTNKLLHQSDCNTIISAMYMWKVLRFTQSLPENNDWFTSKIIDVFRFTQSLPENNDWYYWKKLVVIW
jgi:hypothetical protein